MVALFGFSPERFATLALFAMRTFSLACPIIHVSAGTSLDVAGAPLSSMSIWHWLIVLSVVVLVFRTRLLGSVGNDIESAVLHFKKALHSPKKPISVPTWLKVAVGSILLMCLLMVAERVIAR